MKRKNYACFKKALRILSFAIMPATLVLMAFILSDAGTPLSTPRLVCIIAIGVSGLLGIAYAILNFIENRFELRKITEFDECAFREKHENGSDNEQNIHILYNVKVLSVKALKDDVILCISGAEDVHISPAMAVECGNQLQRGSSVSLLTSQKDVQKIFIFDGFFSRTISRNI